MTSVPYEQSPPRGTLGRRLSVYFYRHPRLSLALLLALPLGWLAVAYLGSLIVLLLAAVWNVDPFTSQVVHTYTLDNFRRLFDESVYRNVAWRTSFARSPPSSAPAASRGGRPTTCAPRTRTPSGTRRWTLPAARPRRGGRECCTTWTL